MLLNSYCCCLQLAQDIIFVGCIAGRTIQSHNNWKQRYRALSGARVNQLSALPQQRSTLGRAALQGNHMTARGMVGISTACQEARRLDLLTGPPDIMVS